MPSRSRSYPLPYALLTLHEDRAERALYSGFELACVMYDHSGPDVVRVTEPLRERVRTVRAQIRALPPVLGEYPWKLVARSAAGYDRWTQAGRPAPTFSH